MPSVIYEKWRDQQAKATYPFVDTATLVDISGRQLPTDVVLDAAIYVSDVNLPIWLSAVAATTRYIDFTISDQTGVRGTGRWLKEGVSRDTVAILSETDIPVATLVVDSSACDDISRFASEFSFAPTATEFVLATIHFFTAPAGSRDVEGVELPAQGDVYIVGQQGIQLKATEGFETVNNVTYPITLVEIHAVGNPLAVRDSCGSSFVNPRFITEVVFQRGDKTHTCQPEGLGDVLIAAATVNGQASALRIRPTESGIFVGLFGKQLNR